MDQSVSAVLGMNVRRLRTGAGVSLSALADAARNFGVTWSSGSVGNIEAGKYKASVENLVVIACALSDSIGREVTVNELIGTDERVKITGRVSMSAATILKFLAGAKISEGLQRDVAAEMPETLDRLTELSVMLPAASDLPAMVKAMERAGEADARVARTMDMAPKLFAAWSAHLWGGKTFVEERDSRAGGDANAQKRGRITRAMKTELGEAYSAHKPGQITEQSAREAFERWTEVIGEPDHGDD